jgi:hypothetical protein
MNRLLLIVYTSFTLLGACRLGADSPVQSTPIAVDTAESEPRVEDKTAADTRMPGGVTPNADPGFDCSMIAQIPSTECEALIALYNSTDGSNWADNRGWLDSDTPCIWSGIECTGDHISHIDLGYNRLAGILPPELGNLSRLHALGLSSNRLHGPIPAELRNLSELVALEISGNQLAGPLPAELGDLPNLRSLSLAFNQLSGLIPPTLGKIECLESLVLSHNQFNGAIPAELGDLANLVQLYLSHNQLSGTIPVTFGKLSHLHELDLSYNQLRGAVPESIAQISQRSLWGNQLEGTITSSGQKPVVVDYEGVHFSFDPSLATSIWPEVIPAAPVLGTLEGPSSWSATPEHLRFTFADPGLSQRRRQIGANLAVEAQILVYPLTKLANINPLVQTRIETLQNLLAETGTLPAGELPLLPVINSAQVFHAQAQYLTFSNIQGLRFISQYSQDPRPILLSQELFYTFQGFTDDSAYYLAAFFPVTTSVLPDTIEVENWEAFDANYAGYMTETTTVLDQLPPEEFTPSLYLLDAVITSLRLNYNDGTSLFSPLETK